MRTHFVFFTKSDEGTLPQTIRFFAAGSNQECVLNDFNLGLKQRRISKIVTKADFKCYQHHICVQWIKHK